MPTQPILVTGGAGFIGSNFILQWLAAEGTPVVNLDKLSYAGNLGNLEKISADPRYSFVHGDIVDRKLVSDLLVRSRPRAVVHFAAESHVDRSIHGPDDFVRTNVNGTFSLLEETRAYWTELRPEEKGSFRFLHVSTDEVYGSLGPKDAAFRRQLLTHPIARTRRPRRLLTTWSGRIITLTACPFSPRTVRIIMGLTNFLKN